MKELIFVSGAQEAISEKRIECVKIFNRTSAGSSWSNETHPSDGKQRWQRLSISMMDHIKKRKERLLSSNVHMKQSSDQPKILKNFDTRW